eukprot:Nk52_evm19s1569 gene=Nk52_evmTU19s1569
MSTVGLRKAMIDCFDAHVSAEFEAKSVEETMKTMIPAQMIAESKQPLNVSVNHVPTGMGASTLESIARCYDQYFIGKASPSMEMDVLSQTVDIESLSLYTEMRIMMVHDVEMPWLLPGIAPTHTKLDFPLLTRFQFIRAAGDDAEREIYVQNERIYWDQATVLKQANLLKGTSRLPVLGKEQIQLVVDPEEHKSSFCRLMSASKG